MDADEIIRRIWIALPAKAILPMRNVTFANGSAPQANRCRPDVLRWTSENAGSEPVHGWLVNGGLMLQMHWFVRDRKGQLFNITPLDPPTPVFEHPGTLTEFTLLTEEIHLMHFSTCNPMRERGRCRARAERQGGLGHAGSIRGRRCWSRQIRIAPPSRPRPPVGNQILTPIQKTVDTSDSLAGERSGTEGDTHQLYCVALA